MTDPVTDRPDEQPEGAPELPMRSQQDEAILATEVQLVLAEKRTALSTIRTGIAVTALPLSIVGLLIATSKWYDAGTAAHLLVPLMAACLLLFGVGFYLMVRAMIRLRHYDDILRRLRQRHPRIAELLEEA